MNMDTLKAECLACTRCELCATRTNVVFGQGVPDAEVLFVGEGPGQSEAEKGLPFESCNRVNELEDAYEAFAQAPEETVILNHLGNVEALTPEWKSVMKKFASLPNLYMKVSGYPTADKQFVSELLKFVRATFDPHKLLYASNWPVVKLYSSFDEHFQILRDEFGDDENFFMNNAARAYGLKIK